CCGTGGTCGYGPEFCGQGNCTSLCDAVAMCGQYGDPELNGGKCGMGLCCGFSGWCGTGEAHCNDFPGAPCQKDYGSCEIAVPKKCGSGSGSSNGRTIGYYAGWNTWERACNVIRPNDIDTSKYTHLYYSFASIDPATYQIVLADPRDEAVITEFTALKSKGIKTWIAVGGFAFSDPGPTHTTWSDLVSTAARRATFIASLKTFMDKYGFQGVDLDWEYPVDPTRGGTKKDTANLVLLVKEMRASLGTAYGISMALAPDIWYLRHFDAAAMEPYVDWFGFMSYDLHGFWDGLNENLGSVIRGQTGIDEITNNTAPLYFAGLDFGKINFGLANYGRGYTVASKSCTDLGCTFSGPSKPFLCTNSAGVMSLTEIENLIKSKNLEPKLLGPQMTKSIQWDDQWMGYDDAETFALKKAWADDFCFGGTMAWSVDYHSGVG
ncbi:Glycoside hydrolase superfamily, partial [Rhypophila decipiens]